MKNLYIDFDGVILDTISHLYNKDIYIGKDKSYEEQEKYFTSFPWETIINDSNIINDSINALKKIIASKKYNLAILTHVNSIDEAILKINYIRKYFDDITIIPCPKKISKTKMVFTKDCVLVDDYSPNLREWIKEGGIGVKFSNEDEPDEFPVINDLTKLIDMF